MSQSGRTSSVVGLFRDTTGPVAQSDEKHWVRVAYIDGPIITSCGIVGERRPDGEYEDQSGTVIAQAYKDSEIECQKCIESED